MTVIITGISSGIGNALAHYYLNQNFQVIGIGRINVIEHQNLIFFEKDLSKTTDFSFLEKIIAQANEIILVNNAGIIGNIERISEQENSDIENTIRVNTIVPMLLCQFVLRKFSLQNPLTIINISSGAGKRPIPSWASYCASKAALDLFSQTIYLEEKERNRNLKVYSVAPGVVDTPMQGQIRKANLLDFSSLDSFLLLKEKDELTDVNTVVKQLQILLAKPYSGQIIYSLRDI